MPQPKKAPRFGGDPAHHRMIMANLSTELFRHGRITTTHAKAKTVQPLAEKMITFAKRGDVHARRQVLKVVRDRDVVHKLFADIGPAFSTRDGGYTRVLKLGPRKGDAAPMALIELVEGVAPRSGEGDLAEAPRRRWSLRRRRGSTLSQSAQEREELRLAAVDRGEDLDAVEVDEPEPDEVDVDQSAATPVVDDAYSGVGADPAEVERRLAAEEASDPVEGPVPAGEQDAPAPERPGRDRPDTATPDADADPDADGPIEGPIPASEQDTPPDVNE